MSLLDIPVSLEDDPIVGPLRARIAAFEEAHRQIAAERDIALLRAASAEQRCDELEHQNRELRKANEAWQIKFEDVTRTLELPKYPGAEPAPVAPAKRGRWRR